MKQRPCSFGAQARGRACELSRVRLVLTVARARQARGESVTAIARHRGAGRSTLYRALQLSDQAITA